MEMKGGGGKGHGRSGGAGERADEGRREGGEGEGWGAEIQAGFRACLNQAGTKLTWISPHGCGHPFCLQANPS